MAKKEEKLIMPDGSFVRYYIDQHGLRTLNMDDVLAALSGPEANKIRLQSVIAEFAQSLQIEAPPKKEHPPRELSDFNQKLLRGLNWNPKEHKKK